ncbi:MAG: hydrogenase iron-sulfur subunit [Promethearchaeota archaeon]
MSNVQMQSEKSENKKEWEPKIIAFLCNWCSYAGADLAGVSRIQYPSNIRIVRVPCSGRVNPFFIIKSLLRGWDGVVVSGCHPGDCHYVSGNLVARRRFAILQDLLNLFGIEPDRVTFMWSSASEGDRFATLIKKVTMNIKRLGPNKKFESTW